MKIDKAYWQNKDKITTSREEMLGDLKYEIWMFEETCGRLKVPCFTFERNLLWESFAIHARVLIDFFYVNIFVSEGKKRNGCDRFNANDIIAQDFMPVDERWEHIRQPITQVLYDAREKANKQLAHLSRWRIKLLKDRLNDWEKHTDIRKDLEETIKIFSRATGIRILEK
ncbi:MAG: hypothetical protein HY813_02650 [Candidatus Portnoybacteria bacterium]|nr:hypothetical protein [Candidatus Portnoybacteria bacterium]